MLLAYLQGAHVLQEALPVKSPNAVSGLDQDRVGIAGRPYMNSIRAKKQV